MWRILFKSILRSYALTPGLVSATSERQGRGSASTGRGASRRAWGGRVRTARGASYGPGACLGRLGGGGGGSARGGGGGAGGCRPEGGTPTPSSTRWGA